MIDALKACPFCGGEAHDYKKIVWNGETVAHIGCADCGARSPEFGDNSAEAWNTRAAQGLVGVPEGYALVPIEPTHEIREAIKKQIQENQESHEWSTM